MNAFLRNYATPLSLVTGVAVSVTGLMMLFGVRGPIGEVHEWIGVAFVAAILMHIIRNAKALGFLFRARGPAAVAMLGTAALAVVIAVSFPSSGSQGGHQGGPWMVVNRVADAPISVSAPALGLKADDAVAKLRAAGAEVDGPSDSLNHISRIHGQPLPRLFNVLVGRD
jgi:hypothetical protein